MLCMSLCSLQDMVCITSGLLQDMLCMIWGLLQDMLCITEELSVIYGGVDCYLRLRKRIATMPKGLRVKYGFKGSSLKELMS